MKSISPKKTDTKKLEPFAIVAVGAATGGPEAFTELMKYLPHNTGMSYVYIQPGSEDDETDLVEVFKSTASLVVQEAKEATRLLPNHVYVIPPNRKRILADGSLKLSLKPIKTKTHLPINDFFTSLADQYR